MWAKDRRPGFTIVELLIVIVVIAVLAAITIVAYNGIQNRARVSSVNSALTQAKKKIALWQIDNSNSTPDCSTALSLVATNTTCTNNTATIGSVNYQYTQGSNGIYCITATNGSTSYKISNSTVPVSGGCNGHGQGGVAPITNLVANPSFENDTTGWGLNTPGFSGTGTSSVITNGQSGNQSFRYTANSSGTLTSFGPYVQVPNLDSSKNYTVTAYVRSSQALSYRVGAELRNSVNANIGTLYSPPLTLSPNSWTRHSLTVPPTANMTGLTLTIYSNGGTLNAGSTIDFDAAMVSEGTTQYSYADGSSPDWAWNGTPNNSTSTGPPL